MTPRFVYLAGLTPYLDAHRLQTSLIDARLRDEAPDTVLLLEHAPTLTVGRKRGSEADVLAPGDTPVVPVERGGGVTWHGPGQLVAYPVVRLGEGRRDLHAHLHALEDAVIEVLRGLPLPPGADPGRDPRNTGAWLTGADGARRKVCSIGIACRKWVTWHGLALNVDPDPAAFAAIRPCGFDAEVITRLKDHLPPGDRRTVQDLVVPLAEALGRTLGLGPVAVEESDVGAELRRQAGA